MKKWYVYELVNLMGSVEYVGETSNLKDRIYTHLKRKPDNYGRGKFYGRNDIIINIAAEFDNKKQAFSHQCKLQKEYGLISDNEKLAENGSKGWVGSEKQFDTIKNNSKKSKACYNSELQSIKGKKSFLLQNVELICPHCKKVGIGRVMYRFHFDRCKNKKTP